MSGVIRGLRIGDLGIVDDEPAYGKRIPVTHDLHPGNTLDALLEDVPPERFLMRPRSSSSMSLLSSRVVSALLMPVRVDRCTVKGECGHPFTDLRAAGVFGVDKCRIDPGPALAGSNGFAGLMAAVGVHGAPVTPSSPCTGPLVGAHAGAG